MCYLYLYHNALRRSDYKVSNDQMSFAKSNKLSSNECGRRQSCPNFIFSFIYKKKTAKTPNHNRRPSDLYFRTLISHLFDFRQQLLKISLRHSSDLKIKLTTREEYFKPNVLYSFTKPSMHALQKQIFEFMALLVPCRRPPKT